MVYTHTEMRPSYRLYIGVLSHGHVRSLIEILGNIQSKKSSVNGVFQMKSKIPSDEIRWEKQHNTLDPTKTLLR